MTESPTPSGLSSEWIRSHFEVAPDGAPPPILCSRCHQRVNWLTKHAVERHGDTDIQVVQPVWTPREGLKW